MTKKRNYRILCVWYKSQHGKKLIKQKDHLPALYFNEG